MTKQGFGGFGIDRWATFAASLALEFGIGSVLIVVEGRGIDWQRFAVGNAGFKKIDLVAVLGDFLAHPIDFGVQVADSGPVLAFEFVQCSGEISEFDL